MSVKWLVGNFVIFVLGAWMSARLACQFESICVFKGNFGLAEGLLFLLSALLIWLFSWGILCKLFRLEIHKGQSLSSKRAGLSYMLSAACSYVYPYLLIGG